MHLFVREVDHKPFDVFVILGRSGSDVMAFTEAIGRLLSIGIRCQIPLETLAENLKGIGGRQPWGYGPERTRSVPDAIAKILLTEYGDVAFPGGPARADICPRCGDATLQYKEGCSTCTSCGYSDC
jgi:ribonucleoside-diphosphate reductase alpha chain